MDVNVAIYYESAVKINDAAVAWFNAVDAEWPTLHEGAKMCGSYDEARVFADSYDSIAGDALLMARMAANAAHHYAKVMITLGYNHALAEWEAAGKVGAEPERPADPASPNVRSRIPLPSAGGPGNGLSGDPDSLVADTIQLAEKIGITIPDGDTTKLSNTADAWDRIKNSDGVRMLPDVLEAVAAAFQSVTAAESAAIDEDLRSLKASAVSTTAVFGELAAACRAHRVSLDELRAEMMVQLIACRDALLMELAINAALSIASSWITFGVSVAVGVAGAAAIAARYARPIRLSIEAWKSRSAATKAVKTEQKIAENQAEMARINQLKHEPKKVETPTVPKANLSQKDLDMLRDYTGSGANELNTAIRSGKDLSDGHKFRVESINEALDKLPNHAGPVTRRTELPQEVLDKYVEGATVTEKSFTSTSKDPNRFSGPVEFQIMSKTGKDVSPYSLHPDEAEVLFKTDTPFKVLRRYVDGNGRTVIQMAEV
ncbi:ADP-ribosyltransferase [Nocardia sp. NPDC050712]|uniref:ADP-ribosyltransferase n=1 Tax=Nocardia sp. NPDC050712 TaxID=3155518 RepID=UPI0033DCF98A